jgi:hypothetical protein
MLFLPRRLLSNSEHSEEFKLKSKELHKYRPRNWGSQVVFYVIIELFE